MSQVNIDGYAIVYCQDAFNTPNGKTAHGLVRFTRRYKVLSVVDRCYAGRDAGEVLDGRPAGIPVSERHRTRFRKTTKKRLTWLWASRLTGGV